MHISKLRCLLAGSLLLLTISCRSSRPEVPATSSSETSQDASPIVVEESAPQPTDTFPSIESIPFPLSPTSSSNELTLTPVQEPEAGVLPGWKRVGLLDDGARIIVPETWVNLAALLDTPETIARLGPTVRLAVTDSKETSNRLFRPTNSNAAAIGNGAFGLLLLDTSLNGSAAQGLQQALGQNATLVNTVQSVVINGVTGAMVDVVGNPLGFLPVNGDSLRLRILTLTPTGESEGQWLVIWGAAADQWSLHEPLFTQMTDSIQLFGGPELVTTVTPRNVVGTLTSGVQVTGNLTNSDTDTWLFNGQSGTYATISLIPDNNTNSDLILSLIDPAGKTIEVMDSGFASDSEVLVDVLLYRTGTYQIQVTEFFRQPGRYTLRLFITNDPQYDGGGRIAIGQEVSSQLPANGVQTWVFEGSAGEAVSIILTPQEDQFDAVLELVGPDGTQLVSLDEGFSGDAEVVVNLELVVTGEYVIVVREFNERGGRYSLSLNEGGAALTNFYDAGDLAYGQVKSETLQEDEAHAWFFVGEAGDEITLVVTPLSPNADLAIWLLDPNLQRLVMQDEFFYGETETVVYTLPTAGQYVILVQEFFGETASYQIVLTGGTNSSVELAGNIANGEIVTGNIPLGKEVVWVFAAQQGDVVTVTVRPQDDHSDLVLILRDPDNNIIIVVDNALSGEEEIILAFPITISGEWTILLQEFFDEEGLYELTLVQMTP